VPSSWRIAAVHALLGSLTVLSSAGTARPESISYDLGFRNLMLRGDRTSEPSISFDITNTGREPHDFVVKVWLAPEWTSPPLQGQDLAPGATQSFTIAAKDLRAGWNRLSLRLFQDGYEVAHTDQEYLKQLPGGLPDLRVVRLRRLSAGTYAFEIKNVGKAGVGAYTVSYRLDVPTVRWFDASPDPAPPLAPGRSFAFVLRDLPEHVANPKKDRFNLLIQVDHLNRIPELKEDNNIRTTVYGYNGSWAENHP
jgi:hypothetical protein